MNFNFDPMNIEIFQEAFAFYGVLSSEGFLLELEGKVFKDALVEPELLIGHKFCETVFWQSAPFIPKVLQNNIEEAAKGNKSKSELDFRVNAQKILTIEFNLIP